MLRSGEWRAARTALPALSELPARPCAWSQDMASQAQAFCHLCSYVRPCCLRSRLVIAILEASSLRRSRRRRFKPSTWNLQDQQTWDM